MTFLQIHKPSFICGLIVAAAFLAKGTAAAGGNRWDDLKENLMEDTILWDVTTDDYWGQCYPEFTRPPQDRSNYNLINQDSGVCMSHFFTAFKDCNPWHDELEGETVGERVTRLGVIANRDVAGVLPFNTPGAYKLPRDMSWNLPDKVLFPREGSDVVAAVEFAKKYNKELSVKNSGHHYTGASTKKNTLLLNMNKFKRYAIDEEGDGKSYNEESIVACGDVVEEINSDLSNQPCQMAIARNKPATIRVGGGENWDKAYRAVKAFNEEYAEANGQYIYHLVGGGAGTVSPMGWTMQGGLSGNNGGRRFGFGVDQVLQWEMVLPTGEWVKFGPVNWENDGDYIYPRTTKVKGVCKDQSTGTWTDCPDEINFDDLWFAVNGGGGGTFGIVLSVYLQLHEYEEFTYIPFFGPNDVVPRPLARKMWRFIIDFLLDPSSLDDVSEEDSKACGAPAQYSTSIRVTCVGEGAGKKFLDAWKSYLTKHADKLIADGIPSELISYVMTAWDPSLDSGVKDWADVQVIEDGPNKGKAADEPKPSYPSNIETIVNILIPTSWIVDKKNKGLLAKWLAGGNTLNYWAFGGDIPLAQDQSNSVPDSYRGGGVMLFIPHQYFHDVFYPSYFSEMYDITGDSFPGFVGPNHAGPNTRGPLKDDWTKPCPFDMTLAERDEKCISLQEAIYGTEKLARLESIKAAVDPYQILDCAYCVKAAETN